MFNWFAGLWIMQSTCRFNPWPGHCFMFLAKHFTPTMPLSTQEYKINRCQGSPYNGLAFYPGRSRRFSPSQAAQHAFPYEELFHIVAAHKFGQDKKIDEAGNGVARKETLACNPSVLKNPHLTTLCFVDSLLSLQFAHCQNSCYAGQVEAA